MMPLHVVVFSIVMALGALGSANNVGGQGCVVIVRLSM